MLTGEPLECAAVAHHLAVPRHDWRLLVGDESALPAIGALLEADPSVPTQVYVEVTDAADRTEVMAGLAARR